VGGEGVDASEEGVSASPTTHRIVTNGLAASLLVDHRDSLVELGQRELSSKTAASSPLIQTSEGRELLGYLMKCAFGWDDELTVARGDTAFVFEGGVGLGARWADGALQPSDQRWVSACLLAHANAFGIEVPMSLRGRHPSLATTPDEEQSFTVQEGAFYGNLFEPSKTKTVMFACAGAGLFDACEVDSNAWVDARACAKAEASVSECGFYVPGVCFSPGSASPAACGSMEAGAFGDCRGAMEGDKAPEIYKEVITVYLMQSEGSTCD
jgi:hypothetical protein